MSAKNIIQEKTPATEADKGFYQKLDKQIIFCLLLF